MKYVSIFLFFLLQAGRCPLLLPAISELLSLLHYIDFVLFVKNELATFMWHSGLLMLFKWTVCNIFFWHNNYWSFILSWNWKVYSFEISSPTFSLESYCFRYSGSLAFHTNLRVRLLFLQNSQIEILIEIFWICWSVWKPGHLNNIKFSDPLICHNIPYI